jgi:hypothetical protein
LPKRRGSSGLALSPDAVSGGRRSDDEDAITEEALWKILVDVDRPKITQVQLLVMKLLLALCLLLAVVVAPPSYYGRTTLR